LGKEPGNADKRSTAPGRTGPPPAAHPEEREETQKGSTSLPGGKKKLNATTVRVKERALQHEPTARVRRHKGLRKKLLQERAHHRGGGGWGGVVVGGGGFKRRERSRGKGELTRRAWYSPMEMRTLEGGCGCGSSGRNLYPGERKKSLLEMW